MEAISLRMRATDGEKAKNLETWLHLSSFSMNKAETAMSYSSVEKFHHYFSC